MRASTIGPQWYVLFASVLWGTTGTAQAFAPGNAVPLSVGAVRLLVASLALLGLSALRRQDWRGQSLPLRPTLLAAAGVAGYQVCFFTGVSRTGVAIGTITAIGSAPVWTGALDWLVSRHRPSNRWLVSTLLAITGAGLLVGAGSTIQIDTGGVILSLIAGLGYALYNLAAKNLLVGHPPDRVMAVVFTVGALFLLPILFVFDLSWLAQPAGAAVALHLGVITTAVAYVLFARGLALIPVAVAVTLTLAEPLTAAALGVVVLGETLSAVALIGVGLLFAGLALLSIRSKTAIRPVDAGYS